MPIAERIDNGVISKLNRTKRQIDIFLSISHLRYRAHGTNRLATENVILAADAVYDNQIVDTDHIPAGWSCDLAHTRGL